MTLINIAENICAQVPHRQFVFTMPKRFRLYFRFNRELLRKLPRLAWETVLEVYRAEKAECQPFPMLGDGKLLRGVSRKLPLPAVTPAIPLCSRQAVSLCSARGV